MQAPETESPGRISSMSVGFGKALEPQQRMNVPFRLLVIGDFGRHRADPSPAGLVLQGETPASLPEQFDVVIECTVDNLLQTDPPQLDIRVPIQRLSGFSTRALTENVELLQRATALRQAVAAGYDELSGFADLDKLIAAANGDPLPGAPSRPQPTVDTTRDVSDSALLLSILDGSQPPSTGRASTLSSVIGSIVQPTPRTNGPRKPVKERVAAIDALIARQLDCIREHSYFATIEATWLCLQLLLRNLGRGGDWQIDLLDVPREDAASVLLTHIVPDELEELDRPPLNCILVLGAMPGSVNGIERLAFCAAAGAALQVPVIASLQQNFWDDPDDHLVAAWSLLRGDRHTQWLAACHGDMLLDAGDGRSPVSGEPGWAVAALILNSVAHTGWPTDLANPSTATLTGLAVQEIPALRGAAPAAWPLRRPPTPRTSTQLQSLGVVSLSAQANRDWVFLSAAPTVAAANGSQPCPSLSDQLFAAFLMARLRATAMIIGGGSDAELVEAIRSRLSDLLTPTGPFEIAIAPSSRTEPSEPRGFRISIETRSHVLGQRRVAFDHWL